MPPTVEFVTAPPTSVVVTRFHISAAEMPGVGDRIGAAFGTVIAGLGKAGVVTDGPAFAYYEPVGDGFDVSAGFEVPVTQTAPDGLQLLTLEPTEVAHLTHLGSYADLPRAYDDLREQVEASQRTLRPDGPMWEEYWSEPGTPEAETRTEIFWPVSAQAG